MLEEDKAAIAEDPREKLRKAFEAVAEWPDGLTVLRHIYALSGYGLDVKRFDPNTNEILPNATLYNLSKRDVWLKVKPLLPPHILAKIENHQEE